MRQYWKSSRRIIRFSPEALKLASNAEFGSVHFLWGCLFSFLSHSLGLYSQLILPSRSKVRWKMTWSQLFVIGRPSKASEGKSICHSFAYVPSPDLVQARLPLPTCSFLGHLSIAWNYGTVSRVRSTNVSENF